MIEVFLMNMLLKVTVLIQILYLKIEDSIHFEAKHTKICKKQQFVCYLKELPNTSYKEIYVFVSNNK